MLRVVIVSKRWVVAGFLYKIRRFQCEDVGALSPIFTFYAAQILRWRRPSKMEIKCLALEDFAIYRISTEGGCSVTPWLGHRRKIWVCDYMRAVHSGMA